MKSKTKDGMEKKMGCKFCGKENPKRMCVVFGAPTPDCPFSMNGGKGMKCLECWTKEQAALAA